MSETFTLNCPIRGRLKVSAKSADGLTPSEEKFRVEAIRFLIGRGYPKENFVIEPVIAKFGNAGRNSFRADFAVLDVPAQKGQDQDWLLEHARVLAEIKRDNRDADKATDYQVKPLLGFAKNSGCVAIYWDNVDQRVFWRESVDGVIHTKEGPIESLPQFGQAVGSKPLTLVSLRSDSPLRDVFLRIEDVLHAASISPSKRFGVMLQLLLAKIYDEHAHDQADQVDEPLEVQDYRALDVSASAAKTRFNALLAHAVKHYERHLPEPVSEVLDVPDQTFFDIMALLAPNKITAVRHSVIQDFYMYFAKGLYRWDLAQYFTPPPVTDFIIETLSPAWNEHIHDPACGSADFLTAAFRRGVDRGFSNYADRVWGTDISREAVQVAVLNMVLNGDGKSNIVNADSLAGIDQNENKFDVLVCNPPFGKRILERSKSTLRLYDLGCVGFSRGDRPEDAVPLDSQETGILFAELCIRQARPGGRIALVLPNGYLGNSSPKYLALRKWLLRHARVAAVVGLPRFTFKGSGADVSASVVFLEKRESPLSAVEDSEGYTFAAQVIDQVGWSTGDRKAKLLYVRDAADGSLVLDDSDEPIIASDFAPALSGFASMEGAISFDWLARAADRTPHTLAAHVVEISSILADPHHTLDPKLLSPKHAFVRSGIQAVSHFRVGDVVDFLAERTDRTGKKVALDRSQEYGYVELQSVESGTYRSVPMLGWELPERAKHLAETGDIFVGGVWGSVRKWFLAGADIENLVVTNGMHRMRLKPGKEDLLLDLVTGLCTEAFAVQMRARARGSDGLAEVRAEDLAEIVLPHITDPAVRAEISPFVQQLLAGFTTIESRISHLSSAGKLPIPPVAARMSHVMIV